MYDELLKSESHNHQELSPYTSINELIKRWEKYTHRITKILLSSVCKSLGLGYIHKSMDSIEDIANSIAIDLLSDNQLMKAEDLLIFKGRIQYNPNTGKPIKKAEWKKLEEAIVKYLKIEKNQVEKKMVEDSFWLGNLIQRLDKEQRVKKKLDEFGKKFDKRDFKEYGYNNQDMDMIEMAELECGIYIQNITERARNKISAIIINDIKQRKNKYEVFQDLWDQEEDINRDWDRVVRTETAINCNNGLFLSQLRSEPEEENIFMKGISSPDACPYCLDLVSEKIVVLKDTGKPGDKIRIEGVEYNVIYPGLSNYGRKPKDYIPAVTIHPYCRCTWERYYPELEKYIKRIIEK
jgi:hypothetical protein